MFRQSVSEILGGAESAPPPRLWDGSKKPGSFRVNSQEPHWCYPNCLRLAIGQSRSLTLPKLCVMFLDHMFQNHNLGVRIHRSIVTHRHVRKISWKFTPGNIWLCVWRGQWTIIAETTIVHSLCSLQESMSRCGIRCNFLPSLYKAH